MYASVCCACVCVLFLMSCAVVIRAKVNARVPGKRDANNLIDEYVAFSRKQIVLTTQRCFADSGNKREKFLLCSFVD
jgi:hypothetical protein